MTISAGLFSKTEEGTGFHSTKSFDSVLCSKSETIYVPHYSPRVNKSKQKKDQNRRRNCIPCGEVI